MIEINQFLYKDEEIILSPDEKVLKKRIILKNDETMKYFYVLTNKRWIQKQYNTDGVVTLNQCDDNEEITWFKVIESKNFYEKLHVLTNKRWIQIIDIETIEHVIFPFVPLDDLRLIPSTDFDYIISKHVNEIQSIMFYKENQFKRKKNKIRVNFFKTKYRKEKYNEIFNGYLPESLINVVVDENVYQNLLKKLLDIIPLKRLNGETHEIYVR